MKIAQQAEAEQVRQWSSCRFSCDRQNRAVRSVYACAARFPLTKWSIVFSERRACQGVPVFFQPVHDSNFIAVLKILPHAFQNLYRLDAPAFQFRFWTNAREHEQLRRVKRSATKNHFLRSAGDLRFTLLCRCSVCTVEFAPFALLHSDGAISIVEQNTGSKSVFLNAEPLRIAGLNL